MAVVINEFEVVPAEARRDERGTTEASPPVPPPGPVERTVEQVLRIRKERAARVRAF